MSQIAKPLAYACTHLPLLDPGAEEFLLQQIEEHKPTHIIHLGDLHEADAVNRFGIEYDWTLGYEMRQARDHLIRVRQFADKVCPVPPDMILMEGNHDWNIRDWHRTKKHLVELIDYRGCEDSPSPLTNELRHWKWFPYEYSKSGIYRLGQITFCHGFHAGQGADKKMALTKGLVLPYGLYVGGHTHRPESVQEVQHYNKPLDIYYCNTGTLGDIWNGFTYMQKKDRSAWGQGVFLGECELWRYTEKFIPNTKCWTGEVRVRRYFNDGPS